VNIRKHWLGSNFAKLWTSNAISTIGDGALLAAGPLLVASQTSEPALVAAAVFAQQLPWILFSLISGVCVDRLDRRRAIILANVLRTIAVGGLTLAIGFDATSLTIIYTALFILGIGDTLADNGAVALLPSVVPKEKLESANSWLQGADILGRQLIGPPLGAYLFVMLAVLPFGLDTVTFVVAALLIARIRFGERPKAVPAPQKSVISEAREGISWLWNMRQLKAVALSIGVMNVTFMAAFASFVLYVQQQLGLGPVEYGILLSVSAVGGVVGMKLAPLLAQRFSTATLLRAGLIIEAVIDISFAANHSPWIAGVIYAVFGMHSVVWGVITTSLRQRATPHHLLGRVNSVYSIFSKGGLAIGALLGGVIAHVYGIAAPFWFAGIVMLGWAGVIWSRLANDPQTQKVI
jgi:MFS family permease